MPKLERVTVPRVSYLIPLLPIFTFCWPPDGDHDALIQVWNLEICDYNKQICLVKIAKLANSILEPSLLNSQPLNIPCYIKAPSGNAGYQTASLRLLLAGNYFNKQRFSISSFCMPHLRGTGGREMVRSLTCSLTQG